MQVSKDVAGRRLVPNSTIENPRLQAESGGQFKKLGLGRTASGLSLLAAHAPSKVSAGLRRDGDHRSTHEPLYVLFGDEVERISCAPEHWVRLRAHEMTSHEEDKRYMKSRVTFS